MLLQLLNTLDLNTILTFILVLSLSTFIWKYFFSGRVNIPGPIPWPILGNLPNLIGARDFGQRFLEIREKYGDMVYLRLGYQPVVVCYGYKLIREALIVNSERTKFRPSWLHIVKKIFPKGAGIFFSDGKPWSEGRKFTVVALKDFGVGKKTIDYRINEEVQFLVEKFSKNPDDPVEVTKVFPMATSNVISNIVFGSRFDYDDPIFQDILKHIDFFFKNTTFFRPETFFPILDKLTPSNQITKAAKETQSVRDYIRSRIDKQRENFNPESINNFLDLYIEQENKPDSKISEDFMFQIITDVFQAGTDSTATTLAWCVLYMLAYPDVQQKCREEILSVVGEGRCLEQKDKANLPYVMATIHEVQRIACIATMAAPHAVLEDTYIGGKLIPKNTILLMHLMSAHFDRSEWDKPEEFRPERFLDGSGKLYKPDAFCPFSMGPRMCLGKQLAENEVFIFLTSFLQRFILCKVNQDDVLSMEGVQTGITRQPLPFKVCFKPR